MALTCTGNKAMVSLKVNEQNCPLVPSKAQLDMVKQYSV